MTLPEIVLPPSQAARAIIIAAVSLAIAAIFWAVLGSLGGWVYQRLGGAS